LAPGSSIEVKYTGPLKPSEVRKCWKTSTVSSEMRVRGTRRRRTYPGGVQAVADPSAERREGSGLNVDGKGGVSTAEGLGGNRRLPTLGQGDGVKGTAAKVGSPLPRNAPLRLCAEAGHFYFCLLSGANNVTMCPCRRAPCAFFERR
jgi:hypothetical protein